MAITPRPTKLLESSKRSVVAAFLPDLDPEGDGPLLPLGAEGTNVAEGLDKHELAAAFAADTEDGAVGLTVPLPLKLQAWGSRLLASKNSLITNDSLTANKYDLEK